MFGWKKPGGGSRFFGWGGAGTTPPVISWIWGTAFPSRKWGTASGKKWGT